MEIAPLTSLDIIGVGVLALLIGIVVGYLLRSLQVADRLNSNEK